MYLIIIFSCVFRFFLFFLNPLLPQLRWVYMSFILMGHRGNGKRKENTIKKDSRLVEFGPGYGIWEWDLMWVYRSTGMGILNGL